jgi:hypothetical protein
MRWERVPPPEITPPMHLEAHHNVINDLEARINAIRDSL